MKRKRTDYNHFILTVFILNVVGGLLILWCGTFIDLLFAIILAILYVLASTAIFAEVTDHIYHEVRLIDEETRKLRKEKKKLLKLKAKKNYLQTKKNRAEKRVREKEKILTLKCQIHNLEVELKGKFGICEQCGAKIYRNACYCSQCGYTLKEEAE